MFLAARREGRCGRSWGRSRKPCKYAVFRVAADPGVRVTAPSWFAGSNARAKRGAGGRDRLVRRECGSELTARGDLQLAVDAREVHLDRLHRDEERLGDLLVRVILRGQLGDAALARGQRVHAGD